MHVHIHVPPLHAVPGAQSPACKRQVPTAQINTSAPFSVAFLDMVRPDSSTARRVFLVTSARFVSFGAVTGARPRLQCMTPTLHLFPVTYGLCKPFHQAKVVSQCADRPPYVPQSVPVMRRTLAPACMMRAGPLTGKRQPFGTG